MSNSHKLQAETAAALEALDNLDLKFGALFGLDGLEASDILAEAMAIVEKVGEIADRISRVKTAIVGAVFVSDDIRATGALAGFPLYAVVASTPDGYQAHEMLFDTYEGATSFVEGVRAVGVITNARWRSVDLNGCVPF